MTTRRFSRATPIATPLRRGGDSPLRLARQGAILGLASILELALIGCGQEAPVAEPEASSYHPLVPGSSWQYEHDDWTEIVTLTATTFEGAPAFLMSDSPNPKDDLRSDAILVESDGRVSRVQKDEYLQQGAAEPALTSSINYGVGFTRFNEGWAERAVGFTESPEYVRVETRPDGSVRPGEARKHTFELLSLSEEVVTAAGTFDCIKIRRTKDWQAEEDGVDASDAEAKTFWFARGIGKVQERNDDTDSTEVLLDFDIPD